MRLLRYLFVSALFWLVFLAGYLCRDALGDWLLAAHSGSLWHQTCAISYALFRVFLTFVLVAVVGTTCVFIVFFVTATMQELWYQFFQRRIMSILTQRGERREKEMQEIAAGDDDGIGAPTEPVNARKHARQGRDGTNNPPKPLGRLAQLALIADDDKAAEDDLLDDVEIKVTVDS